MMIVIFVGDGKRGSMGDGDSGSAGEQPLQRGFAQAVRQNRLHAQNAVMAVLMGGEKV